MQKKKTHLMEPAEKYKININKPSGSKLSSISASQCIVKRDANDLTMSCLTAAIASPTDALGNINTLDATTPLKCMLPSHSKYSTVSGKAFS